MADTPAMETVEELQSKISGYQQQLEQIEAMLKADPDNEKFAKLKEDLIKVINLTSDLISYQSESTIDGKGGEIVSSDCPFKIGDRVEVIGGERPYAAVILSINNNGSDCTIKYFEYEEEVTIPTTSMVAFTDCVFDANTVTPPGFKCQCKYAVDQRYYDCTVDAVTEYGFMITYSQYGTSEEVPLEYLRPCQSKREREKEREREKCKVDANGLIPIPESLKILPTDTEEEKHRKKKKLKAIKSQNRIKSQEVEICSTQKTWQSFLGKKSTKRAAPGSIKESMFASPDIIEGKVGVTRSGLGMTDFERRKRHNFGPLANK
mmetsp:Transcript_39360/g.40096  ORF Transcript_39360/g.40096 Transcript_39360/m.40096 type:complete len:320 (-) Transcript_39360:44-1003(-)|eukprot:CAMPEP_0182419196 /NCGR_PEP_ID=MMETSP1167-20130531/3606_1 /TAXON_ID=2988 /ORGANISM="Mallomonas Sp, Strain CCMP3275" /LENGTH=319 /DNA_ID=CAMNT_0024593895 /DNA_START=47 /DNA_END=1006 /DNA_ORIENTATION=-